MPSGRAADVLRRAKDYPYDLRSSCYALACGGVLPLARVSLSSVLDCEVRDGGAVRTVRAWARRRALDTGALERGAVELLLAYGSNASVAGLSRKLAADLHQSVIPVARACLADFDVVYSAHLTSYGAVPATLQHSPGARTTVHVLVAGPDHCRVLRATEPNYVFAELDDVDLRLERGPGLSRISAVVSRHGALCLDGTEIGLAAVDTRNRRFPVMTQTEVLAAVRDRTAPGADLDEFIVENVRRPATARRRTAELGEDARPFGCPSWRVVSDCDGAA